MHDHNIIIITHCNNIPDNNISPPDIVFGNIYNILSLNTSDIMNANDSIFTIIFNIKFCLNFGGVSTNVSRLSIFSESISIYYI
jgi:hypothetical protein